MHSSSCFKKSKHYEKLYSKNSPTLPLQVSFPLPVDNHICVCVPASRFSLCKYQKVQINILFSLHALMMATHCFTDTLF